METKVMDSKQVVVVVVLVGLTLMSGCTSPGGDGGGGSGAEITFTEDETNGIGIQVDDMGGYDAMWVEAESFEGGYQINEESTVPSVYLGETFGVVGDACFKESHDVECMYQGENLDNAPDPERFSDFERDDTIEVYGLSGGEKTLVDSR